MERSFLFSSEPTLSTNRWGDNYNSEPISNTGLWDYADLINLKDLEEPLTCKITGQKYTITYHEHIFMCAKTLFENIPSALEDLHGVAKIINFFCKGKTYEIQKKILPIIRENMLIFHVYKAETPEWKCAVNSPWPIEKENPEVIYIPEKKKSLQTSKFCWN